MDLRCAHKLHGIVDESDQTIEIACSSSFCGAGRGVVVLHKFNLNTGALVDTSTFQNPRREP